VADDDCRPMLCALSRQAILIAYLMLGKKDALGTAAHIYKGYTAEIKLTDEEKDVLPCLIASRLVQVFGAFALV
jgi:Ser/Thr protein kinase RdoA (MazF antagonist)